MEVEVVDLQKFLKIKAIRSSRRVDTNKQIIETKSNFMNNKFSASIWLVR